MERRVNEKHFRRRDIQAAILTHKNGCRNARETKIVPETASPVSRPMFWRRHRQQTLERELRRSLC